MSLAEGDKTHLVLDKAYRRSRCMSLQVTCRVVVALSLWPYNRPGYPFPWIGQGLFVFLSLMLFCIFYKVVYLLMNTHQYIHKLRIVKCIAYKG